MPPVQAPTPAPPTTIVPPLVDACWLAERLSQVRTIDTRRSGDYLGGHVPGSCSFALGALLVEDTSRPALLRLAGAAAEALRLRGIAPDDHVVLVDDADGSAYVGAVMCELAGVRRVSVMHGGIAAWAGAGGRLETQPAIPSTLDPATWHGAKPRLEGVASFEELAAAVESGSARILDVRSQLEHEGIVGAPCCSARGALPGSVHLEWTAFLDMSGQPHPPERVAEIAMHVGLDRALPIIVMCHAAHRASVAARVLRAAGFGDVRVSLGSWHEWSARRLRPAAH